MAYIIYHIFYIELYSRCELFTALPSISSGANGRHRNAFFFSEVRCWCELREKRVKMGSLWQHDMIVIRLCTVLFLNVMCCLEHQHASTDVQFLDCLIPVWEIDNDVSLLCQDRLPFGRLASKPKQYIEEPPKNSGRSLFRKLACMRVHRISSKT